jgi:hypothetical protein
MEPISRSANAFCQVNAATSVDHECPLIEVVCIEKFGPI